MEVRVQKIVADAGYCSRRKAEELILAGRVKVNGICGKIGQNADPETDTITIDGSPLVKRKKNIYIALNKPRGYLSTTKPEGSRRPVTDLVKIQERIYPVGRLDFDTEGLLLLTNDGGFAHLLTHPRYEIEKTYLAEISKPILLEHIGVLKENPVVEGRRVAISSLKILDKKTISLTIHEGRKHIVKKIFGALGYHVTRLRRTHICSIGLGNLPLGSWRYLTPQEVEKFMTMAKKLGAPD